MGTYIYIPIIALFCYIFLFTTMMAAKKDRIINAFLLMLGAMILWTGGSMLMRMQLWPGVKFWYDTSIAGLLLLGYALFNFAYEFVGCRYKIFKKFWLLCFLLMNIINITTGVFLSSPQTHMLADGRVEFTYNVQWPVLFLFIYCAAIVGHMFYLLFKHINKKEISSRQFTPILIGIFVMFAGHFAFLVPAFDGFPIDIIAGVLNAACMFYALYCKRLFKLTLLASRGSCYALSAGMSIIIFINMLDPITGFVEQHFPMFADYNVLIIALTFTIATWLIYSVLKKFIDKIFVKEEILQAENLKTFSVSVSKSLNIDEINSHMIDVILKTLQIKRIYICYYNRKTGLYSIVCSNRPLDKRTLGIGLDNPLIQRMKSNDDCVIMSEFKRTTSYRSMWEKEKRQLDELDVECFAPLKEDSENLQGFVMLSSKDKNHAYTYEDINFLSSVNSISSIAIKNSRLYERAYMEARTDELTGLLNRKYFYETINEEYARNRDQALSLIIVNIDDFKLYNQLYGNKEGDMALQRAANIINTIVSGNGKVARYSGKEFAVILPKFDLLKAKDMAEAIRKQITEMNQAQEDGVFKVLTVSCGVCAIPYSASSVKELIDNADMAVYHVKHHGKNAVMAYTNGNFHTSNSKQEEKDRFSAYSEYESTIYALTAAIDTKDHYTFSHSKNVAYYSTQLAQAAGMNNDLIEIVREAALLHDIGKIGIPEQILNKPGKLTDKEYDIMKTHVESSISIIKHLPSLDYVIPAIIGHHERFDGSGYPRRISGEDIPVAARILCISDSFDAMTSERSYKQAYTVEQAVSIIEREAGLQFDPKLARLFCHMVNSGSIKVMDDAQYKIKIMY